MAKTVVWRRSARLSVPRVVEVEDAGAGARTLADIEEPGEAGTGPRPLDELLALTTYQGMSDEEIELLIQYRSQVYADQSASQEYEEAMDALQSTVLASLADANEHNRIAYKDEVIQAQRRLDASCGIVDGLLASSAADYEPEEVKYGEDA